MNNNDIHLDHIVNSGVVKPNKSTNRNDKINFSQDVFQLAYQLVADAAAGRVTHFDRSEYCLKYYKIYLSLPYRLLRWLVHLMMVVLLFFDTTNRDSQSLTSKITIPCECVCILFYLAQLFIVYKFSSKSKFCQDKKHYIYGLCLMISILDMTLFMCQIYRIRISPALRILIFVNSSEQSQIRSHLRTLMMTLKDIIVILPFLLTFYFMMVSFIYRYFKINNRDSIYFYDGRPYMQSFFEIAWSTIVYITSANSPDIMLPAFSKNAVMGMFFLLYYAIFFFLLIFIYGLIMGHFRHHAQEEVKYVILGKLSLVYESFILLSEVNPPDINEAVVSKKSWDKLMKCFPKYGSCQQVSDILFRLLTDRNEDYLTKCEFMRVGDLLAMPLTMVSDSLHFFERHAWFHFSNRLADLIEGKLFGYIVMVAIVSNCLCITFTNEPYVELFFTFIFLLEISMRIYVKGIVRFFHGVWNIFDFLLIFAAFVFWFLENLWFDSDTHTITFTLLVLRNLRLLKLLRGVAAYHQLLHILGMLFPTIISLLLIVFGFTAVYVCIGIWTYRGLFYPDYSIVHYMLNTSTCNLDVLSNVDFARMHYCILSFNTFISGFVMLCSISIGNNWHTLSEGYEIASGNVILTRMYFSIFKAVVTYLLLLIVASVLDIFLLAYKQKGYLQKEDCLSQKLKKMSINFVSFRDIRESRQLKNQFSQGLESFYRKYFCRVALEESKRIWIRIKVKGARSVEYVSQAMFQSEIEEEIKSNNSYKHFFTAE